MEEKLSKRGLRKQKIVEEKNDINSVMLRTNLGVVIWTKHHDDWAHEDYYCATMLFHGFMFNLQCAGNENCRFLNITLHPASRIIHRTRHNKGELDTLLALINAKISLKEKEDALKRQDQEDTDTKPLPPPKEDQGTQLFKARIHREELGEFLKFLRNE